MDLLQGSVNKHFFRYLFPSIGIALSVAIYGFIDTIAIGQGVGPDGAAACAVVLPIFYLSDFIAGMCGVGGSVLMGNARGEKNPDKANAYFTAATVMGGVLIAIIWILGMVFQDQFYVLFGADDVIFPIAKEYGSILFIFLPCMAAVVFLDLFIRADGSPRITLISTLIGAGINIVGDYVLVFPLDMGMRGAAIATVVASVFQALFLITFILMKKTKLKLVKPLKWLKAFRRIASTGFGSAIGALSIMVVSLIANNQIMTYLGDTALAIYGILATISATFMDVFVGVGESVQPLASQNYGAGKNERCIKALYIGLKTTALLGLVFAAICMIFPNQTMWLFVDMTPEITEMAPYILRVYCASYLPMAINVFMVFYLQSVGQRHKATIISLSRGLVTSSALLLLFPIFFGGDGIWWAVLAAEIITLIISVIFTLITKKALKA